MPRDKIIAKRSVFVRHPVCVKNSKASEAYIMHLNTVCSVDLHVYVWLLLLRVRVATLAPSITSGIFLANRADGPHRLYATVSNYTRMLCVIY